MMAVYECQQIMCMHTLLFLIEQKKIIANTQNHPLFNRAAFVRARCARRVRRQELHAESGAQEKKHHTTSLGLPRETFVLRVPPPGHRPCAVGARTGFSIAFNLFYAAQLGDSNATMRRHVSAALKKPRLAA